MVKQILVVNHDVAISDYLAVILGEKFNVITFQSTTTAIEWLNAGNLPDLVIMDAELPTVSGLALMSRFRRHVINDTPILLMSEHKNYNNVMRYLSIGANDFIARPFHSADLIAKVEELFIVCRPRKVVLREVSKLNNYSYMY